MSARGDASGPQATDAPPAASAGTADGWRRAACLADLDPGVPLAVTVDDVPLCLVADDGGVAALDDRCAHQEFPLSDGDVADGTIMCSWHGARFDLRTGACVAPPLGGARCGAVRTYDTRVIGDDVWVRVG